MSSFSNTKKRKGGAVCVGGDGGTVAAGLNDTIAEMKVHMTRIQNEMETRIVSMQNEMDSRATATKSLQNEVDGMKSRCQFLETRCGSLERCVEILMKDWEYSAPPIPRSHWVDRGFNNHNIALVERFLDDIKMYTCKLRKGNLDDHEIHLHGVVGPSIIMHDDVLLPHWKEFADALQLLQLSKDLDYSLVISDVQLTSPVINILTPALVGKSIKTILLENNRFMNIREGIDFAIKCMKSNRTLKKFGWANTQIDNIDDVNHMVGAITSHPSIEEVRLEDCFGENINSYVVLRTLLDSEKQFTSIDFDGNNIQTGGGTEIPDFIATNPPLADLLLENNNLNDDDAVLIARALKHNTNLKSLNLGGKGGNNITKIGIRVLANVVYDSTSLDALSHSNHTCYFHGIDLVDNIPVNSHILDRKDNRARKIYHLLSLRNREGSNVHHLSLEFDDKDDISLKLVPKVLESVHRYNARAHIPKYVYPLSIIYEIVRSWKMPELFETSRPTKQMNGEHK